MGCFEGMVFGLTGGLPRKQVEATLKSNGASVSAIIHKRVGFVVCTPDAIKSNTQKVRKANKHCIPLVSQGFLSACINAKRVVDHTAFLVSIGSSTTRSKSSPVAGVRLTEQPTPTVTDVETADEAALGVVGVRGDGVSVGRASVSTEEPSEEKTRIGRRRRRRLDAEQAQEASSDGKTAMGTRKDGDRGEGPGPSRTKRLRLKNKGLS